MLLKERLPILLHSLSLGQRTACFRPTVSHVGFKHHGSCRSFHGETRFKDQGEDCESKRSYFGT